MVQLLLAACAGSCSNTPDVLGHTAMHCAAAGGHADTVELLLTVPELTPGSNQGAARAAAEAGHAQLAVVLLEALMLRGKQTTAAHLLAHWPSRYTLAAGLFRQWWAAEGLVRELEARWPALQQLLVGIIATQKQLQAAPAHTSASAVSASL
jgi:ankyrin repeat protein